MEGDPWATWLLERRHGEDLDQLKSTLKELQPVRDRVLENAAIVPGHTVLDVGAGDGLIGFGALERVGEDGRVFFSDISDALLEECRRLAEELGVLDRCEFVPASADDLRALADGGVDAVTTRSALIYVADKGRAFREFHRVLRPGGRLSIFEPINSFSFQRRKDSDFFDYDVTPVQGLADKVMAFYLERHPPDGSPMLDFDERDLLAQVEQAGFREIHLTYEVEIAKRPLHERTSWDAFRKSSGNPFDPTLQEAMDAVLAPEEARAFEQHLRPLVERGEGGSSFARTYLWAEK